MPYNIYTVRLEPPKSFNLGGRSDLAALFDGYTYIRVRSDSGGYAAVKGLAMVPWAYVNTFSATAVGETPKA